jgi:transcriptional regulator with XRE-family HTH domain
VYSAKGIALRNRILQHGYRVLSFLRILYRHRAFGTWLQAERIQRGWSYSDLSLRSGLPRGILEKIERGAIKPLIRGGLVPDAYWEISNRLADAFGYPRYQVAILSGYRGSRQRNDPMNHQIIANIFSKLEAEDLESTHPDIKEKE